MDGPLTPILYRRLVERFEHVKIANEGDELIAKRLGGVDRAIRPSTTARTEQTSRPEPTPPYAGSKFVPQSFLWCGEYYRICCPKCDDTRYRLWINHRVVEYPWMIHCYNENCYDSFETRMQLFNDLFKTRRPQRPKVNKGRRDDGVLRAAEMPGKTWRLDELPLSHHANNYLAGRGYDPWELGKKYGVSYCESSSKHRQCIDRIIIPISMNRKLVGWQARYIGETNWKRSGVPKYYGLPGMQKRQMLYNKDQASLHPWMGLQEGVTDVWSTGPFMMALLGKTISFPQRRILAFPPFLHRPLVVMLDGDARIENEGVTEELKKDHLGGVVMVDLPEGTDPGDLEPEVNLGLIRAAAKQQGVVLPDGEKS